MSLELTRTIVDFLSQQLKNNHSNGNPTMADENNADQLESSSVTEVSDTTVAPKKQRSRGGRSKSDKRVSSLKTAKRQRYSVDERVEKISQIEALLSDGRTLKAAIKEVGISEQTYYNWKRNAVSQDQPEKMVSPVKAEKKASAELETLADLVELEAENKRLRIQLAEKLRAENAELRKRLGMN